MQGLQLTADPRGRPIARPAMTQPQAWRSACLAAVRQAGLAPLGEWFHRYPPAPGAAQDTPVGVTGVLLLAESPLAVHTWPALGAVTLAVHRCNLGADNAAHAHPLMDTLVGRFEPAQAAQAAHHARRRGAARVAVAP